MTSSNIDSVDCVSCKNRYVGVKLSHMMSGNGGLEIRCRRCS